MHIRFWGVRGSLPAPLNADGLTAKLFEAVAGAHVEGVDLSNPDAVRAYLAGLPFYVGGVVGGNTTCVEVTAGGHTLVLDAGSGIRPLGLSLLRREFGRGQGTLHLFFTHAHWDHLMGFPYFKPIYVPGNRIICYAVNHHPLEYLRHLMTAPTFFPIDPDQLEADFEFVTLKEGEPVSLGPLKITTLALYHPGVSYAYRIEDGDSVFVFATDAEFKALDADAVKHHIEFFRGADVLAFDAQFSLRDAFTYEDWGHSSAMIGVDLALQAGARRLITVHHDPNHTDRQIWEVAEAAQEYARLMQPEGHDLEVTLGYDGLEVYLTGAAEAELREGLEGGALVLSLAGRLNPATARQVRDRLRGRGDGAWRQPVAIDLSQVLVTEAGGVAALVEAVQAAGDSPLTLIAPGHRLRAALRECLAAVGSAGAVYQDKVAALAAIIGPASLRLNGLLAAGRYRLNSLVTTNDQAALYEAHDTQMDRPVVVDVLSPGLTHAARQNYLEGFRAWNRMQHPALQAVLDILPDEGGLTMVVLEVLHGQTLKEHSRQVSRDGHMPLEHAVSMVAQVIEALGYLHKHGLVHGDLRPDSIYWNGGIKIAVSGVSSLQLRGSSAIWLGPATYYAPERLNGEPATPAADLFASGLILYQLLSGVHPFESEMGEVTALQLASGAAPPSLRAFNPLVTPALEAVVHRLMAHRPADRYPTAHAAAQALHTAL